MDFAPILARHAGRIALQLSGGKDSLATALVMRPLWPQLTLYWLDSGSAFPEVRESVDAIEALGARVVRVQADQPGCVRRHGFPADVVPVSHTPLGIMARHSDDHPIQSRYDCCARVLWQPMSDRMRADDITLIIRGEKGADRLRGPLRNGSVADGIEYLFPIEDWTDADVMRYLAEQGVPIPRFYGLMHSSPDCMDCSAWWEENRAAYLREYHPEAHARYLDRLVYIGEAVQAHTDFFNIEVQ